MLKMRVVAQSVSVCVMIVAAGFTQYAWAGGLTVAQQDTSAVDLKKGIGISINSSNHWYQKIDTLHVSWYYHWGDGIPDSLPNGVEWVPMIYSFHGDTTGLKTKVAYIDSLVKLGKVHAVLGFNEPNNSGEANMTVQQALQAWPYIMKLPVPLGSPAPTTGGGSWLAKFMQGADSLHYRVNFIALHWYAAPNVGSFLNFVENAYKDYHLPIWITEFAVADYSAKTVSQNKYSPAEVLQFMKQVLPALDTMSFVQRYAWHSNPSHSASYWTSMLFDTGATYPITKLGEYYSQYEFGLVSPAAISPIYPAYEIPRETTLKWGAVPHATRYHLQIATNSTVNPDGSFESQYTVVDTTVADTIVQISSPLDSVKLYFWHVSAIDSMDTSSYSSWAYFMTGTGLTAVKEAAGIPQKFALIQNYPNPFNPSTVIKYDLPKSGMVSLKVYNVLGEKVATLVDERQSSGYYSVTFNADRFASGVYFYVLRTSAFTASRKMMFLK